MLRCRQVSSFQPNADELMQCFDGQRYALTTADAKRDKATRQTVTPHRVDQLGRQHCTRPKKQTLVCVMSALGQERTFAEQVS